jgi:hypothetical protein
VLADELARRDRPQSKSADQRYWRIDEVARVFARYRDNYRLLTDGADHDSP